MLIYRITNSINNKSYIGQTRRTLKERWKDHCKKSMNKNIHFHNAIKKYGIDCWNLEVLEEVSDKNLLNDREIFWIAHYDTFNNGYNSTTGGYVPIAISDETRKKLSDGAKKRIYSEETRKKMSEAGKGRIAWNKGVSHSDETKEKIRKIHLGSKRTEETRKNQSNAQLGHLTTSETKKKISEANKGRKHSEETKQKIREKRKLQVNQPYSKKISETRINKNNQVSEDIIN